MTTTGETALNNIEQFIMNAQNASPEKSLQPVDDLMQKMIQGLPLFQGGNMPLMMESKGSSSSDSPRNDSPNSEELVDSGILTQNNDEVLMNILRSSNRDMLSIDNKQKEYNWEKVGEPTSVSRSYRVEPWHECFNTTSEKEFDALIYSVYVMIRDEKRLDGFEHYECINRLQSKCRYRVRVRRLNEFIVVEERGAHNHAMEPVGTPGSHAGLPKTLREIVDLSFREDWTHSQRQARLDEEVKRLGLPHNPRLGRQVDNRLAYLRRVKNLTEMKKIQEQLPSADGIPFALNPDGSMSTNSEELMKLMSQMSGGELPFSLLQSMQQQNSDEMNSSTDVQVPHSTNSAPSSEGHIIHAPSPQKEQKGQSILQSLLPPMQPEMRMMQNSMQNSMQNPSMNHLKLENHMMHPFSVSQAPMTSNPSTMSFSNIPDESNSSTPEARQETNETNQ